MYARRAASGRVAHRQHCQPPPATQRANHHPPWCSCINTSRPSNGWQPHLLLRVHLVLLKSPKLASEISPACSMAFSSTPSMVCSCGSSLLACRPSSTAVQQQHHAALPRHRAATADCCSCRTSVLLHGLLWYWYMFCDINTYCGIECSLSSVHRGKGCSSLYSVRPLCSSSRGILDRLQWPAWLVYPNDCVGLHTVACLCIVHLHHMGFHNALRKVVACVSTVCTPGW